MSRCQHVVGQAISQSLRQINARTSCRKRQAALRHFSSTAQAREETIGQEGSGSEDGHATMVQQMKDGTSWSDAKVRELTSAQLGSRRKRAAMATTGQLPFEQLPYQCFQEARKILKEDREEKITRIIAETGKIKLIEEMDPSKYRGGDAFKTKRLKSMRAHVERLKILADINDPLVKRRFEDGQGDMSKPIYRYLAEKRWRSMDFKITVQRIMQFNIVPDILPSFEPRMDVKLFVNRRKVRPGEMLDSLLTERAPSLRMQVFDRGERLLSIVVEDSDVPEADSDSYQRRLHFMALNIPWDPAKKQLNLAEIPAFNVSRGKTQAQAGSAAPEPDQSMERDTSDQQEARSDDQIVAVSDTSESSKPKRAVFDASPENHQQGVVVMPWLPAHAQKGSPYHRLSFFVLKQDYRLNPQKVQARYSERMGFSLKGFRDLFDVEPVGYCLFRTKWDEHTADVMARHGLEGAEVEFKPRRVESLKPPRKARGWEAKRQKPKYRSLWKYTKRIA